MSRMNQKTTMLKYSVWIEAEHWAPGQWDSSDCNSDVKVSFEKEGEWVATFFTYQNLSTLAKASESTWGAFERQVLLGDRYDLR